MAAANASTTSTLADRLRGILSITNGIKCLASQRLRSITIDSPPIVETRITLQLSLPPQDSLVHSLRISGVPHDPASRLSAIFHRFALKLREDYERGFRYSQLQFLPSEEASRRLAEIRTSISKIYTAQLEAYSSQILALVKSQVSSMYPSGDAQYHQVNTNYKRRFNHEYVPLLEHFFEENPFPSYADKDFLARKTGMHYRQINVWFQNHRSRTRKEGRTLRKRFQFVNPTLPLDGLVRRMGDRINHETPRIRVVDPDVTDNEQGEEFPIKMNIPERTLFNALETAAPPHAFPSVYPPQCEYQPFPCKDGILHFIVPRGRRSASYQKEHHSTDFEDFIEKFSKLALRDDTRKRKNEFAATTFITTKPPTAPLPAFIPSNVALTYTPGPSFVAIPAPAKRLRVFESPGPRSRLATLIPSPVEACSAEQSALRRKIMPLPKRTPKNIITHRASTSTPSSPTSRTSSLGTCPYSQGASADLLLPVDHVAEKPRLSSPQPRSLLDPEAYFPIDTTMMDNILTHLHILTTPPPTGPMCGKALNVCNAPSALRSHFDFVHSPGLVSSQS